MLKLLEIYFEIVLAKGISNKNLNYYIIFNLK